MAEFNLEGLLGNIGSAFGGGTGNFLDEYLTEDQRRMMQRNAMLAASAALLKAGGESTRRIGIGEALGSAFEAGQAGYEKAQTGALTQMALRQRMEDAKRGKLAPINPKDYTQASVQAYIATNNPGLLVAAAPKAANPFAPLNPKDYTPESLRAFMASNQVGDLVPVAPKAANPFAPLNPRDYTPDSLRAFITSQNPADLVAAAAKPANAYAPINPKDYTPESLRAYGMSGQVGDLVAVAPKPANVYGPIDVSKFTPASLKAFGESGQFSDLAAAAAPSSSGISNVDPSKFTSASLAKFSTSGNYADLEAVAAKPTNLVNQIDAAKFTPASVAKFSTSGNYADLEPIPAKIERPTSLVNQIDAAKFTPASVSSFSSSGGDYSLLVPIAQQVKPERNIANVSPNDFTAASLAKFNTSGNYADLVRVPDKPSGAVDRAPTLTTIVDPTNPNQMLSIDARRYSGGGVGSPGVLGVSGKEPGAATRQVKTEAGKSQLADDLSNLRASFLALDKMNSIPSTQRGVLSNITSGVSASGIGQKAGQLFGTEAQVERDVINSARSRLVNSIKNATGMSAQQLNSNVELQTMLRSISDPGHSIQAALRIIDDIEKAYVTGSGAAPPPATAPGGASRLTPAQQAELDKLRLRFGGQR